MGKALAYPYRTIRAAVTCLDGRRPESLGLTAEQTGIGSASAGRGRPQMHSLRRQSVIRMPSPTLCETKQRVLRLI